jgi:biuret amidohydrolase
VTIDPNSTALLVIHCQGDIVGADGAYAGFFRAQIEARNTLGAVAGVVNNLRAAGVPVIFTRVAFAEDYSDLDANCQLLAAAPQMGCLKDGAPLAEIVPEVGRQDGDQVLTHQRVGAFQNTGLDESLRSRGIDTVVLVGVATNLSVETTARYASELGYRTVVVSDATSAATPEAHAATLESLALLAEVVNAANLLVPVATV